jgi:hypothetical protein
MNIKVVNVSNMVLGRIVLSVWKSTSTPASKVMRIILKALMMGEKPSKKSVLIKPVRGPSRVPKTRSQMRSGILVFL